MQKSIWDKARANAFRLPNAELMRHAGISIDNRHECRECFTCACLAEARVRLRDGRMTPREYKRLL